MKRTLLGLTVGLALLLSACGTDATTASDQPTPSAPSTPSVPSVPSPTVASSLEVSPTADVDPSPAPPAGPACDSVWVDGSTIPAGYAGCEQGGSLVKAKTSNCASGQVLVTYGDRFYGVLGNRVNDVGSLKSSLAYRKAQRACGG